MVQTASLAMRLAHCAHASFPSVLPNLWRTAPFIVERATPLPLLGNSGVALLFPLGATTSGKVTRRIYVETFETASESGGLSSFV